MYRSIVKVYAGPTGMINRDIESFLKEYKVEIASVNTVCTSSEKIVTVVYKELEEGALKL